MHAPTTTTHARPYAMWPCLLEEEKLEVEKLEKEKQEIKEASLRD